MYFSWQPRTSYATIVIGAVPLSVVRVKHCSSEWAVVGDRVFFGSGVSSSRSFASLLRFLVTALVASTAWYGVRRCVLLGAGCYVVNSLVHHLDC